jgi:hypothetical protein
MPERSKWAIGGGGWAGWIEAWGRGPEPRISGTTTGGGWVAGGAARAGGGDVPGAEAVPTLGWLLGVGNLVLQ